MLVMVDEVHFVKMVQGGIWGDGAAVVGEGLVRFGAGSEGVDAAVGIIIGADGDAAVASTRERFGISAVGCALMILPRASEIWMRVEIQKDPFKCAALASSELHGLAIFRTSDSRTESLTKSPKPGFKNVLMQMPVCSHQYRFYPDQLLKEFVKFVMPRRDVDFDGCGRAHKTLRPTCSGNPS